MLSVLVEMPVRPPGAVLSAYFCGDWAHVLPDRLFIERVDFIGCKHLKYRTQMTGQPLPDSDDRSFLPELHTQISNKLAQQDHRYTRGRKQLVEVLAQAGQPMTLPDIVAADPKMARSSAYRNLDVLVRCGAIRRINSGGEYAHFELAEPLLGHHHHLICISCGSIEDVHLDGDIEHLVDKSLSEIADRTGFTPTHHSLDLHGHCAHC